MYLTVSPIREDRQGRSRCERSLNLKIISGKEARCANSAEYLVMFRKSAHPRDSKPDLALCSEHATQTVTDMMIYMAGYKGEE